MRFTVLAFNVKEEEHSILVPDGCCNQLLANRPLPTLLVSRITGNSGGRFHSETLRAGR